MGGMGKGGGMDDMGMGGGCMGGGMKGGMCGGGMGGGMKGGGGNQQNMKPGDWFCPNCNDLQFAKNNVCRKCGTPNPNPPSMKGGCGGGGCFGGGKGGCG